MVLYSIIHVDINGEKLIRCVTRRDKQFWIEVTTNSLDPIVSPLGNKGDRFKDVIQLDPLLVTVGQYITEITHTKVINTNDLLAQLVVEDRVPMAVDPDQWRDCISQGLITTGKIEEFVSGDEVIAEVQLEDGFACDARWVTINDDRAFVATDEDFSAVVLIDVDANELIITNKLLDWAFYNDSIGPMSWDGAAELGECGPALWALNRRGDVEPGCWIVRAPSPGDFADQFVRFLDQEQWVLPYLVKAFAMKSLSESEVQLLHESEVQGQWVFIHLDEQMNQQVIEELLDPRLGLQELTYSLLNPQSLRGLCVYGWLRQIAYGPTWSATWFDVFAAMLGEKGPPPAEGAPEGTQDEWVATINTVKALKYQAPGYAPDIEIPSEVHRKVWRVKNIELDLREINLEITQLTQQTSQESQDNARVILGVPLESNTSVAWEAFERLVDEQPVRMFELHAVYWSIQHYQDRVDRLKQLLPIRLQLSEATDIAQTINWPLRWPDAFAPLWVELGGTAPSARSWATQRWTVQEVLTEPQLKSAWNGSVNERVRNENAPDKHWG